MLLCALWMCWIKTSQMQLIPFLWQAILVLYMVHLSKIRIMSLMGVVTMRLTLRLWCSCLCCCSQSNTPSMPESGWRDWGQLPAPEPVTLYDPWSHPLQHLSVSHTGVSKQKNVGIRILIYNDIQGQQTHYYPITPLLPHQISWYNEGHS